MRGEEGTQRRRGGDRKGGDGKGADRKERRWGQKRTISGMCPRELISCYSTDIMPKFIS